EHVDYLGGVVLPAAVNRFTDTRGIASNDWSVHSDVHGGLKYVRAIAEELHVGPQIVNVASDIPAGSGLSSSAALLVAVAYSIATSRTRPTTSDAVRPRPASRNASVTWTRRSIACTPSFRRSRSTSSKSWVSC